MRLPEATWRLLKDAPARGAWNMAVDEAILESVGRGDAPAALRLYAWEPACLSLGVAQPFSDVNAEALASNGWEVVRRQTGGKAILHTDELTYAVIAPQDEPRVGGDILESYQRLSTALVAALELLSVPIAVHESRSLQAHKNSNPICFEIVMDGKKLIGSAQARRHGGVLQHGTLPLYGEITRITEALAFNSSEERASAAQRLNASATTVENALQREISWEQAAGAFADAFAKTLNLNLALGELSAAEEERAEALMREKYARQDWTQRV
jgi:lipoate-protein ligase A